tara:strand:- start:288 stop:500 length:213 start_codon:yes stop_codon:yes gene_type:complete
MKEIGTYWRDTEYRKEVYKVIGYDNYVGCTKVIIEINLNSTEVITLHRYASSMVNDTPSTEDEFLLEKVL